MIVNPGKFNKKLTFIRRTGTKADGFSKYVQKEETVRVCWGNIKATAGTESYELQRLNNTVSYDIRTRYQRSLMDDTLIIEAEGRRFEIRSVVDIREEHKVLSFTCVEILKAGESHGRYLDY